MNKLDLTERQLCLMCALTVDMIRTLDVSNPVVREIIELQNKMESEVPLSAFDDVGERVTDEDMLAVGKFAIEFSRYYLTSQKGIQMNKLNITEKQLTILCSAYLSANIATPEVIEIVGSSFDGLDEVIDAEAYSVTDEELKDLVVKVVSFLKDRWTQGGCMNANS